MKPTDEVAEAKARVDARQRGEPFTEETRQAAIERARNQMTEREFLKLTLKYPSRRDAIVKEYVASKDRDRVLAVARGGSVEVEEARRQVEDRMLGRSG